MWLCLPEPKAQKMAHLAETQEMHDKHSKSGLKVGPKGAGKVHLVALGKECAAVKACP